MALGKVTVSGQEVSLDIKEGSFDLYEGHPEEDVDGNVIFEKDAEFHLQNEGRAVDILGPETAVCAYEREDYSGNEYRFRDDPVEENYDYVGLTVQVLGGLVIVGGVAIASGGLAAGAAAVGVNVSATAVMGAAATGGTFAVAGLAVSDLISRRVSSMDEYVKSALSGSIVGAMTGAVELVPAEGLARAALDFGAGASGSIVGQLIMDGEVDPARVFKEGVLAMGMAELGRRLKVESGEASKKGNKRTGVKYKFSEDADDHLNNVKGFKRGSGGIVGGHNMDSFWEFERPIQMIGDIKYSHVDGVFEIDYTVGKMVRGKYDGWLERTYTKTLFNPDCVSVDDLRKWAEEAFDGVTAVPVKQTQLRIRGTADNGLKFEGWIDVNTQEIRSYYPVLDWGK